MFKTCLFLALFVALASAGNLAILHNFPTANLDVFQCYLQNGIDRVVSSVWDETVGPVDIFNDNFKAAKAAGIPQYDAIVAVNGRTTPQEVLQETLGNLPPTFSGTVWIQPWWHLAWAIPMPQRLAYIDSVVQIFKGHGLKLGIYSSQSEWTFIFGDRFATTVNIQPLPLYYVNADGKTDFNDFSFGIFGGWNTPSMKEYTGIMRQSWCHVVEESRIYYEL